VICIKGFRAGSVALPRSLSWLTQVLSTLPIPYGWALVPVTARSTSPYRRPLHTKQEAVLEHFVMVGDGKGSHFKHLLWNAQHLTLEARFHCSGMHNSGCHFDLKQVGFTATYLPRRCLLTSRNTFFPILRAGFLEPHGSESCTWHKRDLIWTLCTC
jgi:hypothetical protein